MKGVKWYNITSYFLVAFGAHTILTFMNTFLSFIIKSKDYYNEPNDEAATTIGNMAFYAEISVIIFTLFLGSIMDFYGRKFPIIIGFLVSGISMILIPFCSSVFPFLYILR